MPVTWTSSRYLGQVPKTAPRFGGFQDRGEHPKWVLTDFNPFEIERSLSFKRRQLKSI
jgi:hypothetical protein